MLLKLKFPEQYKGFFVDVGAHHPSLLSNTKYFYDQGWRGINIDAMPGSMEVFDKHRKRDINIFCGIGPESGHLDFFVFNETAQNTFSHELAAERDGKAGIHLQKKVKVPVFQLREVLDKYLPEGQKIDFLSVDVEGLDLEVLQSNDWTRYRPSFVVCEKFGTNIAEINNDPFVEYMLTVDYRIIMVTSCSMFFENRLQEV